MSAKTTAEPLGPLDPRLKISALWVSVLLIFAYVDLFAFFRADILNGALAGQVAGIEIGQGFLAATTVYILLPCLMVPLTLMLPLALNRWANVVLALLYALSIVASCIGETWVYYWIGSAVEVALLCVIARLAWAMKATTKNAAP